MHIVYKYNEDGAVCDYGGNAFDAMYARIINFVFYDLKDNNNFEFFSDNTNAIPYENYENFGN